MPVERIEGSEVQRSSSVVAHESGVSKSLARNTAEPFDSPEHGVGGRGHEERECRSALAFAPAENAHHVLRVEIVGLGEPLEKAIECFVDVERNPGWQQAQFCRHDFVTLVDPRRAGGAAHH
ncbi:hypothetical protein AU184_26700 [Mycolicibacterium novocastrense]|nr:hypothetical protein AU183_04490 [Mycolicibacterium novocastrense]KUH68686.1 hypothetical protein AU184_26700 [Mycolicibacterium novocastrense]KUH74373.1 hypothetical protein AU072_17265 [Mycolicibacterium novocastrense]